MAKKSKTNGTKSADATTKKVDAESVIAVLREVCDCSHEDLAVHLGVADNAFGPLSDVLKELEAAGRISFDHEEQLYSLVESESEAEEAAAAEGAEPDPSEASPDANHWGKPTRYLKHFLTAAEITLIREEREEEDREIETLRADLDTVSERAKSLKKRIEVLIEDGAEKSKRIRTGFEMRNVPCEERRQPDARVDSPTFGREIVVTYRLDTDEAIDWRELRADERQGRLFDQAPAATPANGVTELREASL